MDRPSRRRQPSRFAQKSSDSDSESEEVEPARPGKKSKADDVWVCCDKCSKWRRLPGTTDPKRLPRRWYCSMNPDNAFNSCRRARARARKASAAARRARAAGCRRANLF